LLDNLHALDLYNCGATYNVLATSLRRASEGYYQEKNAREIYLRGCVAMLQVSDNLYNYDFD